MSQTTVQVGTSAVELFAPQVGSSAVVLTNAGVSTLYVGQSGVTAATGLPLPAGQTLNLVDVPAKVYGIAGAGPRTGAPADVLSADASAGATSLTVASGGDAFVDGMSVYIDDGADSETVTVGSGSQSDSVVVSALANAHAVGTPFAQVIGGVGGPVVVSTGA